ncbi:MAG: DNA-directed RNA polymerase subunit beta [Bacilli bacterium]|jgi:DNA-directed RNA polymerase subunit beta|nr:DNA-directed RNA polymerase subunit beta [Bacilli bacterium]MCH4210521.1 DNA-directed RNA polymerase subunit beta [Bacilli bacterium]MCH4228090.1 DNA-directed RNA polymerase subunit beta [Bacilli bacterium]MCI2054604.1 DNA-directed RNA polymerase subunit beta [Bacilli bacterium]
MAKENNIVSEYESKYEVGANGRINFSKISGNTPLPYLVEIQTDSFNWFKEKGLDEVLKEVFPIANYAGTVYIDYVSCHFEEPEYGPLECKEGDLTYSSKLKVKLRLRNKQTGEIKEDNEVFMGDVPMMTDSGTFIVNGAERVIVSQIVRSPGAYFQDTADKSGAHVYNGEIIPTRGTWLQFESDLKGVMWVRIDRQRKMPASILFKALGIDTESRLNDLFGDTDSMKLTLAKDSAIHSGTEALIDIFKKLKPGEPITPDGVTNFLVQKFFDDKRYDLGRAGRFKYSVKLGIYDRLPGRILAENLVSADGEILFTKNHKLTKNEVEELRNEEVFEKGAHYKTIKVNEKLDTYSNVNSIKVYAHDKLGDKIVNIIGTDLRLNGDENTKSVSRVTISDMIACFSYFCNIQQGIGNTDDIDHLGNRRVRCVGELLQTQFRIGLTKMSKTVQQKMSITDLETAKPQSLVNIRPLTSSIREFFASSQLSQFMDQTNPLAELTNKRRISALGPGGLTRDRASMEVRDVHYTHYGRICPIETPEGQNIGLINNLATYAKINKYGFLQTPYRVIVHKKDEDGKEHYYVSNRAEYLSADEERSLSIAEANIRLSAPIKLSFDGVEESVKEILDDEVICRHDDENILCPKANVDYVDVSPEQIVSIAAACIPFLDHDDSTRALMGANMQRQALPLLRPSIAYVGTGLERVIAKDSGLAVVAVADGEVSYVDSSSIVVKEGKNSRTYHLQKFDRSNQGTCINQNPIVKVGDKIVSGDVIADGPAMRGGELALGQNVLVAYMTWHGYNYEDAVIMSEKMVKDDTYTSIHIEAYDLECRETKLGDEEITRDIPNVSEEAKAYLDESGIVIQGAEVKEGDILVGKVTPKGQTEPTPEEKLLMAIFAEKTKDGKDSSLRVPHGGAGIVLKVRIYTRKKKDPLSPGVIEKVRVYIVQKRKISEGDKMSGRHGNKGVISKILPVEDMPFLPDGTPIDVMLSPMGVPSRMNIGQILEIHLGLACRKLGIRVATPVFDGVSNEELIKLMDAAGISSDGKTILYDGQTGEQFEERISVGIQYMIKLVHMVDDKLHARATGPYSLVTQQPLGGKAQNGGQRFGEMEVWALEAYGAAHMLQEMITIKSDDRVGRRKCYEAIIKGNPIPRPGMPEAFKVFTKELKGLGMDVHLYDHEDETIDMDALAKEALIEERKVNSAIRNLTSPREEEKPETVEVSNEQAAEEGLSYGTIGDKPSDAE